MKSFFRRFFAILLCAFTVSAYAETIPTERAVLRLADGAAILEAKFDFHFSHTLQNALESGVPLFFVFEWEVSQPRWYWFDKVLEKNDALLQLSYMPLTKQYRISSVWLSVDVNTLAEAEERIGDIGAKSLFSLAGFDPGERYTLSFRLRLDPDRMSRTMQVNALGSSRWSLSSGWQSLDFIP
jgi:hypothetical protein